MSFPYRRFDIYVAFNSKFYCGILLALKRIIIELDVELQRVTAIVDANDFVENSRQSLVEYIWETSHYHIEALDTYDSYMELYGEHLKKQFDIEVTDDEAVLMKAVWTEMEKRLEKGM